MADNIYLDFSEGVKRVMNNTKLYVKLLGKFRGETKLDDLEAALETGDFEKAQNIAHTIKGLAANLSLTELFKQSLELEMQLKEKKVCQSQMELLKITLEATIIEVDKVINENG